MKSDTYDVVLPKFLCDESLDWTRLKTFFLPMETFARLDHLRWAHKTSNGLLVGPTFDYIQL